LSKLKTVNNASTSPSSFTSSSSPSSSSSPVVIVVSGTHSEDALDAESTLSRATSAGLAMVNAHNFIASLIAEFHLWRVFQNSPDVSFISNSQLLEHIASYASTAASVAAMGGASVAVANLASSMLGITVVHTSTPSPSSTTTTSTSATTTTTAALTAMMNAAQQNVAVTDGVVIAAMFGPDLVDIVIHHSALVSELASLPIEKAVLTDALSSLADGTHRCFLYIFYILHYFSLYDN
jgi:hypothetical protein